MWRYTQTLFRRKEFFLVPVILVPMIAIAFLALTGRQYEVHAVAWVEPTSLLDPLSARSTEAANRREAQRLNEWLSTDFFRKGLLDEAGLTERAMRGEWPPPSALQTFAADTGLSRVIVLRSVLGVMGLVVPEDPQQALKAAMETVGSSIKVAAEGDHLLHITYLGSDPYAALRLVEGTISLYRSRSFEQRTQDVQQSIDFYARQLRLQEQRLREASTKLQDFLRAHPAPALGQPRPADESAELDQLRQEFQLEETLYGNVLRTLESVRIEGEAIASNQQQRVQVVDLPQSPEAAGLGLKRMVLMLLTGLVLGVLLGGAGVVLLTWLDRRVRSREDVAAVLPAPVHLHMPHAPSAAKSWPPLGQLLMRDL